MLGPVFALFRPLAALFSGLFSGVIINKLDKDEHHHLPDQELKETEKVLFDLRFKKATRQPFKPHEIKAKKKKIAMLKTILRNKFLN